MNKNEKQFMTGMWDKVSKKEEDLILSHILQKETIHTDTPGFFKNVFLGIGLRQLYFGMTDVLVVAFSIMIIVFFLGYRMLFNNLASAYAAAFINAPVFFGAVCYLDWIKEKQNGTYDLQQSCKYTFFHLLSARMLSTSITGLIFNLAYLVVIIQHYPTDAVRLFAISFSSLMIFSVLLIAGLELGHHMHFSIILAGGWLILNLLLFFGLKEFYCAILDQIPLVLLVIVGISALAVYMMGLKKMTTLKFRKEYADASN